MKSILKKINLVLCLLSIASLVYADGAIFVPTQHSDLLNSGTNTHSQIDDFIASKGQPNGLAALDGSGNIVVSGYIGSTNGTGTGTRLESVQISSGTGTLSGVASPFIAQTNGTATGTQLNSVQIVSGTSNLSGVASPYIAQTNGTSTGGSHTATYIYGSSTIQSTSESNSYILNYSLGTTTPGNISTSGTVSASNLVTGWKSGSTYGYGLINLAGSGDFIITPTYDNSTKTGTWTISLSGTTSAKPNLLQDGVLKATSPGSVSFNTNFSVDSSGSVSVRNLVQQTNGTASGTQLNSVQIVSGTGTLSGVASPFVAQTSGTGTLLNIGSVSVNHNGAAITGGTISGVDMCFGDNDTGINWVADGNIQIKANANAVIDINSNVIPTTITIGDNSSKVWTTHYGTSTFTNLLEVTGGGVKYPDGYIQATAAINMVYGSARRTGSLTVTNGTWTNVNMDASGSLYGFSHPATETSQLRLTVGGVYRISGKIQARGGGGSVGIRICKNNQSELTGGTSISYMNYGDANSGMPIVISPFLASLNASDYIYMQVGHNYSGPYAVIDYGILGTQPNFGTITTALIEIEKIGN